MDSTGKTRLIASTLGSDSSTGDFQTPEIEHTEIRAGEKIGGGSFGVVYKGTVRGKTVAIKQLHSQVMDEETLEDFRKEIKIMVHLRHPNIVLFMGACTEPGHLSIVTELLPAGSLHELLHNPKIHISLLQKLKMMQDLALGMNWLHCSKPPILHRDLKSTNVLVDEHWNMKICDFGLSTIFDRGQHRDEGNPAGTPIFMSPEVLKGKTLNQKADVYAFALVCWEILTRKDPFDNHTSWEKFKQAVCEDKERPPIPEGTHSALEELLKKCWHEDPDLRPSFAEILPALEEVTLQVSFPDSATRSFWKAMCVREKKNELQYRLPFASFVKHLWHELKLPPANPKTASYKCMHSLLAERMPHDEVEMVSMQRLSHFSYWFGSLFQSGENIVDKVQTMCNEPWFHGDISKDESEKIITGKKSVFLVRLSTTDPHATPFTISKTGSDGKISHQRVYAQSGGAGFYIIAKPNEVSSGSLTGLIKLIKKSIGKPIESTRYRAFFLAEPQNGGYQDEDD